MEEFAHFENDNFGEYIKDLSGQELKNALIEKKKYEIICMVIRQTNYDYITAKEKLESVNGNYLQVIKDFLQPEKKEMKSIVEKKNISTNQMIYNEIRGFMDNSVKQYEKRKEYTQKMMEYQEKLQRQKERLLQDNSANVQKSTE